MGPSLSLPCLSTYHRISRRSFIQNEVWQERNTGERRRKRLCFHIIVTNFCFLVSFGSLRIGNGWKALMRKRNYNSECELQRSSLILFQAFSDNKDWIYILKNVTAHWWLSIRGFRLLKICSLKVTTNSGERGREEFMGIHKEHFSKYFMLILKAVYHSDFRMTFFVKVQNFFYFENFDIESEVFARSLNPRNNVARLRFVLKNEACGPIRRNHSTPYSCWSLGGHFSGPLFVSCAQLISIHSMALAVPSTILQRASRTWLPQFLRPFPFLLAGWSLPVQFLRDGCSHPGKGHPNWHKVKLISTLGREVQNWPGINPSPTGGSFSY